MIVQPFVMKHAVNKASWRPCKRYQLKLRRLAGDRLQILNSGNNRMLDPVFILRSVILFKYIIIAISLICSYRILNVPIFLYVVRAEILLSLPNNSLYEERAFVPNLHILAAVVLINLHVAPRHGTLYCSVPWSFSNIPLTNFHILHFLRPLVKHLYL